MFLAPVRMPVHLGSHKLSVSVWRVLDVLIACTALAMLGPIMAIVAVTILLETGRPIFFSQIRLGQSGRHFRMYKFRKFHKDCRTGPCVTVEGDPRLTQLGKYLEKAKLDELPQLWNVLKGDMSIVGPRPEALRFVDCFTRRYLGVLDYKPGIFGPNQFLFRNEGSLYPDKSDPERFYREVLFPLKAEIDLEYFRSRTIAADIEWIIRGVLVVFGLRAPPSKFKAVMAGWLNQ
jgi:lipopolysaccharide/colanic/teichoic acid biosynthesis glycosyltransferase